MAAKNRPEELRELKTEELTQKLVILSEERFRLEFRRATEALTNPLLLRTITAFTTSPFLICPMGMASLIVTTTMSPRPP